MERSSEEVFSVADEIVVQSDIGHRNIWRGDKTKTGLQVGG